jgi:hypothetical protein
MLRNLWLTFNGKLDLVVGDLHPRVRDTKSRGDVTH